MATAADVAQTSALLPLKLKVQASCARFRVWQTTQTPGRIQKVELPIVDSNTPMKNPKVDPPLWGTVGSNFQV